MATVDLHIHTIHSDGSKTPEEIVSMSRKHNINTIAITDHDNIDGSKKLIDNHPADMTVYSGVELTIKTDVGRMHMLGYNIDLYDRKLNDYLIENKATSIYNLLLYIEIIKKDFGIVLTDEEIERLVTKPGNVGRPDIAVILVQRGYCSNVSEAFDKYLRHAYKKASKVKKGITPQQGIDLIKGAGGIPVLAHPNSLLLSNPELEDKIIELKSYGLEGIESTHINENPRERKFFRYLAKKHNLLETGGTDYHGDNKPDVFLGTGRNHNVDINDGDLSFHRLVKSRYR